MSTFVVTSIIVGSIFILVGLAIALFKKQMSPQTAWILRVIVSLGAGFVAAGILGPIEIGVEWLDVTIDAGGPMALLVFVYWKTPDWVPNLKTHLAIEPPGGHSTEI